MKKLHSMTVRPLAIEHLRLAYFLQLLQSFDYQLNWHLIKDLFRVIRIVTYVQDCLYTSYFSSCISPPVYMICHFLHTAPVHKNLVLRPMSSKFGEFVLNHPFYYLLQGVHR